MKKILVVVDMQNDFITGPLGTPEAVSIVDKVVEKIRGEEWDYIFTTHDMHDEDYLETQEGKKLPVMHCQISDNGWKLNEKIFTELYYTMISNKKTCWHSTHKDTFGCLQLIDVMNRHVVYRTDISDADIELTLVGVCTDICVISNALLLKAHYPEMKIVVDASCCAGSTPLRHMEALDIMESCQIDVVNRFDGEFVRLVEKYGDD